MAFPDNYTSKYDQCSKKKLSWLGFPPKNTPYFKSVLKWERKAQ